MARFPDAPTERGKKHIKGLADAVELGYTSVAVFVSQMKGVKSFEPNDSTHKAFGDALREATEHGVTVLAYDCKVTPDSLEIDERVKIEKIEKSC